MNNQIPLSKQAGFLDTVKDLVIAPDAGPLETILTVAEDAGIILTGGWVSIPLMALKYAGWGPSRIGKIVDQALGLKTFSDLSGYSSDKLAETAVQGIQADSDDDSFGSPLGAAGSVVPLSLRKQAIPGMGLLLRAFKGLFKILFGWLANPSSKLSMALRALGVVMIHKHFGSSQGDERQKSAPTAHSSPKQQQLENVVDQILGDA